LHTQHRRILHEDINRAHDVTQRAKFFLLLPRRLLHDLRIQSHTSQLDKVVIIGPPEVDFSLLAPGDPAPARFDIFAWQTQLNGKDVHRSQWQDAHRRVLLTRFAARIRPADTLKHLIHRAITAGGDHQLVPFGHQPFSDHRGVSWRLRQINFRLW